MNLIELEVDGGVFVLAEQPSLLRVLRIAQAYRAFQSGAGSLALASALAGQIADVTDADGAPVVFEDDGVWAAASLRRRAALVDELAHLLLWPVLPTMLTGAAPATLTAIAQEAALRETSGAKRSAEEEPQPVFFDAFAEASTIALALELGVLSLDDITLEQWQLALAYLEGMEDRRKVAAASPEPTSARGLSGSSYSREELLQRVK